MDEVEGFVDEPKEVSTETAVETPESVPESTETPEVGEETSETGDKTTEETPVVAAAYKPDFKVKVYDEEKEITDPFLKGLIKDAESEKNIKELFRKGSSLDTYIGRHEKLKENFQSYQQQTQPVVQYYNDASNMLKKGDLESFFELLQIPNETIFRYAVQKAEQANLPPDQQWQLQNQRQIAKQKESLETQNQNLQTQQQQQLSQFRSQELSWVMARPDVHPAAQAFDQRVGQPGAFRQAVIEKGLAHHAATGKDLSAEQAAQEVLKLIGAVVTPTTPTPQAPLIQQNGQPPIIPNVTGRGTSPVKKQVRSITDLKKRREELRSS